MRPEFSALLTKEQVLSVLLDCAVHDLLPEYAELDMFTVSPMLDKLFECASLHVFA